MINLEQLAYLSDKDLKRYIGRDDSKVRLGEYYIGKQGQKFDNLIIKVIHITKHRIITTGDLDAVNTWSYDDLNSRFLKLTEKVIARSIADKRKELFSKVFLKTLVPYKGVVDKVLSNILPEEQYEISLSDDSNLQVIIHLPEFTISNTAKLSHTIKDFYIKIGLYNYQGTIRLLKPTYARTTYTLDEILSNYKHSHTSAGLFVAGFRDEFCYGHTEMGSFLSNIQDKPFDIRQFSTFIVNLLDFLKWESLEGTPYRYISRIGSVRNPSSYRNVVYLDPSVLTHSVDKLLSLIADKIVLNALSYEFVSDKITLSNDSKTYIEDLCTMFAESSMLFELDSAGRSVSSSDENNNYLIYNNSSAGFMFKGELVRYKVEGVDEINNRDNRKIHRDILKQVFATIETFIESELTKDYYNEYITN